MNGSNSFAFVRVRNTVTSQVGTGHGYWSGCSKTSRLKALNIAYAYAASDADCETPKQCKVIQHHDCVKDMPYMTAVSEKRTNEFKFAELPNNE